jgi:hypothetical protein
MLATFDILARSSPDYIFTLFVSLYFVITLLRETGSPKWLAVKHLCLLDSVTFVAHIA